MPIQADSDGADAARRAAEVRRAEIRRFVREHHPDRGGDAAAFAEGLRALRDGSARGAGGDRTGDADEVTVYRKARGVAALADWAKRTWNREHRRYREHRFPGEDRQPGERRADGAGRHHRESGAGRRPRVR